MAIYRSRQYARRISSALVLAAVIMLATHNGRAALALVVLSALVVLVDSGWRLLKARQPQPDDAFEVADEPVRTAPNYGLPRWVFEGTGGRVRFTPRIVTENAQRSQVDLIRRHYGKGTIVLVVGPKGEAGKTTDALGIGQALSASGVSVIVFDLNGAGNLAQRVGKGDSWPSITKLYDCIRSYFKDGELVRMLPRHVFRGGVESPNLLSTDVGTDIVGRPMENEHPLTTKETLEVLEAACNQYDVVIVDGNNRLKFALGAGDGPDGESNDVTDVMQGVFEVAHVLLHAVTTKNDSKVLGFQLARTLKRSGKPVVTVVNEKARSSDGVSETVSQFLKYSTAVRVIPFAVPLYRREIFWWSNLTSKEQRRFVSVAAVVVSLARGDKVDLVPPGLKFIHLRVQTATKAKFAAKPASEPSAPDPADKPAEPNPPATPPATPPASPPVVPQAPASPNGSAAPVEPPRQPAEDPVVVEEVVSQSAPPSDVPAVQSEPTPPAPSEWTPPQSPEEPETAQQIANRVLRAQGIALTGAAVWSYVALLAQSNPGVFADEEGAVYRADQLKIPQPA